MKGRMVDIGYWKSPNADEHCKAYCYNTTLCALMLTVYYRHLPTFRPSSDVEQELGLSDKELSDTWDIIGFSRGKAEQDDPEEADADADGKADRDTVRADHHAGVDEDAQDGGVGRAHGFQDPAQRHAM
jgi:hypothetical protein